MLIGYRPKYYNRCGILSYKFLDVASGNGFSEDCSLGVIVMW